MKKDEKDVAIKLRQQGTSMAEIASRLGVAKSTVSYWVRDTKLSDVVVNKLKANSHSRQAIERRRTSRMAGHETKRQEATMSALNEATKYINNPLWCVAVSLYWGEGGKTQRTVRISNSDPAVIKLMMKFFTEFCDAPMIKIRGHVHTFTGADPEAVVAYWAQVSGVPRLQFYKTYIKNSIASKHKRNTLPWGTCQIYVYDSVLFIKLMAWIEYLKNTQHYGRT